MSPADTASTAAGVAAAHAAPTGDAAMETTAAGARRAPLILFGAFDRHNLGDLLLGRIAAKLAARLLTGREGLGYGDFKLLAALGAWCGWQALPSIVLIAALGGIIMHCLLKPFENKNNLISFGPYIAFSGLVVFIAKIPHIMF